MESSTVGCEANPVHHRPKPVAPALIGRLGRLLGQKRVPIHDGGGGVDELSTRRAGSVAQHLEGGALVHRVALHQDALRTLGDRTTPERALQVVVLGEAAQTAPSPGCGG